MSYPKRPFMRYFPLNHAGRDFVAGDLHGEISLLLAALRHVDFDGTRDRLFSVGDLVDRGDASLACLGLLDQPWFHAVLGNHDDLLLDYHCRLGAYDSGPWHPFCQNGGQWYFEGGSHEVGPFIDRLAALPLMIVVGRGPRRFRLVHAEVCRGASPTFIPESEIEASGLPLETTEWISGFDGTGAFRYRLLWGRALREAACNHGAAPSREPGASPIFCGHTITAPSAVGEIREVAGHWFLDTGASLAHTAPTMGLTLFEPDRRAGIMVCADGTVLPLGMERADVLPPLKPRAKRRLSQQKS